jgi:hypothetical protein
MKKIFLLLLIVMTSCTSRRGLVGTWQSGDYTIWERGIALLHGRHLGFFNVLVLNEDSTWRMGGTCEVFEGRKWRAFGDSLYLFPDTCWFVSKESQSARPAVFIKSAFLAYKIKRNKLEKISRASFTTKEKNDSSVRHDVIFQEVLRPHK